MRHLSRNGLFFLALAALGLLAGPLEAADAEKPGTTPGFDINALDRSVRPCDDFYQFACGKWIANNPVPPDRPSWTRFAELQERNLATLKGILDQVSAPDASRDAPTRLAGDYYAACMDEAGVDAKGAEPLAPTLARIAALSSKSEIPGAVAALHEDGVRALFRFGSDQDFKDASSVIADADQGGLGLPDRDYYLKQDQKSQQIRKAYVDHVARMFELLGDAPEKAAAESRTVMEIETGLAKASLERVKRRNPDNIYHKMELSQLQGLSSDFDWKAYLAAVGAPPVASLNVAVPGFFEGMNGLLQKTDLDGWKTYLRWHVVNEAAPLLSGPFVDENFAFYGKVLQGTKELRPRWKRCVALTDHSLGEALGKLYVEKTFGKEGKQRMAVMVAAIEKALHDDIETLPWMSAETKTKALAKLAAIANKIGYPDKWRDYSSVTIARDDLLGNTARAAAFELKRRLDKIGKPVDRGEWRMSPPTVNAYYSPQMNDINFPAGILQPPFFDRTMDDAINFGGIGAVIGHELTHGFDDQGRKFDGQGNLKDWWTDQDAAEFEKRAACIEKEYSGFTAVGDVKLNGKLTLGENTADNGGLRIAYMALEDVLDGKPKKPVDGFTPEQRLFLGWAQVWCQNRTDEIARFLATVDPHSPGRYRVNGVVSNMPEFQQAYQCKASDPMVREDACRVW